MPKKAIPDVEPVPVFFDGRDIFWVYKPVPEHVREAFEKEKEGEKE